MKNVKARRSKCKQIEGDLERPVVYYITLCDENGYSTTGNQLYRGLLLGFKYTDWLEVYGDSDYPRRKEQTPELARFIKAVEASMPTARPDKAWKPALGEQLQDAERRYARSKAQLKHIRKSLKFLRRRLNQFYADNPDWDWDKPLPWYIFHVDFTRDVSYRRHQHETHRSSIPVMNLLDSLFRMLYPGSGICARFKVLPCLVEFRRRRRFAAIL
ncbi:hypothetical protein M8818_007282 [Zalaria obscura]|uniref:Uncharacterized protein n=1 Tax=Zalaria obscura TaxID=2024903 RepID=A0ACC3S7I8_9PEZI